MKIEIKELSPNTEEIESVKEFLLDHIKNTYGYGYTPEFHYDIKNLKKMYVKDEQSNFYIAKKPNKEIVGCIGIRGYDKNFEEFKGIYFKNTTASIWRLMVDSRYRRQGIATKLVNHVEKFSKSKNYENIYLHTQRNLPGALKFWQSQRYSITHNIHNEHTTVHMIKYLQ
ncbi:MAG: GNAT family N-acetyltransferase [Methanobrevibacter sp.]|nr:GNAT family N-acetyltransferase [Methanobrevibacter sp.]